MLGESRMSPRASSGTYVSNSPADKRWCGRLPGHPGGCQFLLHFGAYAKDFNAKWWQAFFPAFLPSVSLASTTDSCIASFQAADWCATGRWCWWIDCIAWKWGIFASLWNVYSISQFFYRVFNKHLLNDSDFSIMNGYSWKKTKHTRSALKQPTHGPRKESVRIVKWSSGEKQKSPWWTECKDLHIPQMEVGHCKFQNGETGHRRRMLRMLGKSKCRIHKTESIFAWSSYVKIYVQYLKYPKNTNDRS